MKYGKLLLEKKDYVMIKRLINLTTDYKGATQKMSLLKFAQKMEYAEILDEEEIPNDVVRINSVVTVATMEGWSHTFQVVLPAENSKAQKKISLLLPMGIAVLGHAQKDRIRGTFPREDQDITILEVKQNNITKLNIA